jgi:hypothetical protein
MDNRDVYIEEGERPNREASSQRKPHKRERNLLERLREAQEAEARALERFQRAQAKLERRKARIQRLEQRLTRLKEEQAGVEASTGEALIEQPTTNGYVPLEVQGQDVLAATATLDGPLLASTSEYTSVEEEAASEAEDAVTPELQPPPEPAEMTAQVSEQTEQEEQNEQGGQGEVEEGEAQVAAEEEAARVEAEGEEQAVAEEGDAQVAAEEDEQVVAEEEAAQVEQEEQAALSEETQPIQRVQPVAQAEVAAIVEEEAGVTESAEAAPPPKSAEQVLAEAREVWHMADAAVNLARSRAQDLATSISILGQANLSSTLMEELLHKQAEANKALVDAQRTARVAYEELVLAEETYRASQQQEG